MKRSSPGLLLAFATVLIDTGTRHARELLVSVFATHPGADPLDVGVIVP